MMMPTGLRLVRATPEYTDATVPVGLLSAHRVADGVWGRLRVRAGTVGFVFETEPSTTHDVPAGGYIDIAPTVAHRVEPRAGCRFVVEFWRADTAG